MSNFDDIFAAQPQEETAVQPGDDGRDAWIATKQRERESINAMVDNTTRRIAVNGELFQTYLDSQPCRYRREGRKWKSLYHRG